MQLLFYSTIWSHCCLSTDSLSLTHTHYISLSLSLSSAPFLNLPNDHLHQSVSLTRARRPKELSKFFNHIWLSLSIDTLSHTHTHTSECDQIGQFLKVVTNLLAIVAQIYGEFWGYFRKCKFFRKTSLATFWTTFWKKCPLLIPLSGHTVTHSYVQD